MREIAERLNGPGARALAALEGRAILDAWEGTVAAFLDPASPERREIADDLVRSTRLSPQGLEAGLRAVLGGVRGEAAGRVFAEAARRSTQDPGGSGGGPGFALVVLASNLPALAVQPLLPALAARRPALLECPSAEPVFTPAFVRALARRLPPLGEAVAVACWRGGDEAIEAPLLELAGVVLAYGDADSVASLERRAPGKVVAYGPKTSLAVIGAGVDPGKVAPGLARDVALFDQRGCLSIAAVYLEGGAEGGAERARAVASALAAELEALAERWPPGPRTAADAAAVRQLRDLARMTGAPAWEIGDSLAALAAGTVIVDPDPTFRPTPGLRTVRVHPLPDLAALPALLAPWRGRLQGAALAGLPKEKAGTLVPALDSLGVSRITAPGDLQHPDTAWHNGGVDPLAVLLSPSSKAAGS